MTGPDPDAVYVQAGDNDAELLTALERLDEAVQMVDAAIGGWLGDDRSPEQVAGLVHELRGQRQALHKSESYAETVATRVVPTSGQYGPYWVTRRSGTKRTSWDHERIAAVIVNDVDGDPHTAYAARDRLLQAAGIGYWRTTVLRRYGIDPDDYTHTEPGRPSIDVELRVK